MGGRLIELVTAVSHPCAHLEAVQLQRNEANTSAGKARRHANRCALARGSATCPLSVAAVS